MAAQITVTQLFGGCLLEVAKAALTPCIKLWSYNTFFAHAGAEALAQSAVAALVALVLVDDAASLEAARVDVVLAHRAPEEALAAVARRRAVVLPGGAVVADGAVGRLRRRTDDGRRRRRDELGCSARRRVIDGRRQDAEV